MTRSESREQAFILIFETQFSNENIDEVIMLASEIREFKISRFANELVYFTVQNKEMINEKISSFAVNWDIKRISKVSLSVLQLAIGEIMNFDDIPVNVTINEAVELCKKYGGEEDFSFVNGVLGSYAKTLTRQNRRDD